MNDVATKFDAITIRKYFRKNLNLPNVVKKIAIPRKYKHYKYMIALGNFPIKLPINIKSGSIIAQAF